MSCGLRAASIAHELEAKIRAQSLAWTFSYSYCKKHEEYELELCHSSVEVFQLPWCQKHCCSWSAQLPGPDQNFFMGNVEKIVFQLEPIISFVVALK